MDIKQTPLAKLAFAGAERLYGDKWETPFARLIGASVSHVHNLSKGARPLTDDMARQIAEALIEKAAQDRKNADAIEAIASKILAKLEGE